MKETIITAIQINGPINRKDLLVQVNDWIEMFSTERKISDRSMRKLIEQLIREGHVIASSEKGYSIVTNLRELTEAVRYLKAPVITASIRANTLIGNYDRKYQEPIPSSLQFRLF